MPAPAESGPDSSGKTALGVVLVVLGLPFQLIGHGFAGARVIYAALEPYWPATEICAEFESSAWSRCFETAFDHPLDSVSSLTLFLPLPGLILSSIGGWLLIRSSVGHARRERLAWRVLITAWTLHLHGWLLLCIYFSWSSDVPRWIALVAVPAGALTVILVVRVRTARMRAGMGPPAWRLTLADVGITSVVSAAIICDALLLLMGVHGVLIFGASPAGIATALAGALGLIALIVANRAGHRAHGGED